MLAKLDTRGRIVLGAGILYLAALIVLFAYAALEFRDLYSVPLYQGKEPEDLQLSTRYQHFLRLPLLALAVYVGIWAAAFGTWRKSYVQGLAALAAGIVVSAFALAAFPWVHFQFDQYPVSFGWVFGSIVPAGVSWILVTVFGRKFLRPNAQDALI